VKISEFVAVVYMMYILLVVS